MQKKLVFIDNAIVTKKSSLQPNLRDICVKYNMFYLIHRLKSESVLETSFSATNSLSQIWIPIILIHLQNK